MKAAEQNFTVDHGTTWEPVMTYKGPSGNPVDLTGVTGLFEIRFPPASGETDGPVILLTTENGGMVLGDAAGTIQPIVTDTTFSEVTVSSGRYVLELFEGDTTIRLLKGKFSLTKRF